MKVLETFALSVIVLASCKRSTPPPVGSVDASALAASDGGPARGAAWDGPFGGARTPSKAIVLAVAGASAPSLGIVALDPKGTETVRRRTTELAAPLRGTPSIVPFKSGGFAVAYAARHGEPQVAVMSSAAGEPVSPPAFVGSELCGTDDALYFLEKGTRRLRRWDAGAREPRPSEGPAFGEHSTPLCGARAAFVLEPKESGFDVALAGGASRAHVAAGVDPQNAGSYAAYVRRDGVGLVYALASGALAWTTVGEDGKATTHALKRKLGPEESIVAADGASDRLAVLLQHDDKKRCGEDETPPAYDVLEVVAAPAAERVAALPPAACDSEASPPDLQLANARAIVRWFEWKEGTHEKRLVFWASPARPADTGTAASGDRRVPDDTFLLDCDDDCLAVGREGDRFRVVAVP